MTSNHLLSRKRDLILNLPPYPTPPPPKRPQPSPAPAPRPEPVKQEIIELSDEHYENTEQYAPEPPAPNPNLSTGYHGQDPASQSYDDGGAHAMVPADEGGMEDMQGDGTQGEEYYSWEEAGGEGYKYVCQVCK